MCFQNANKAFILDATLAFNLSSSSSSVEYDWEKIKLYEAESKTHGCERKCCLEWKQRDLESSKYQPSVPSTFEKPLLYFGETFEASIPRLFLKDWFLQNQGLETHKLLHQSFLTEKLFQNQTEKLEDSS